MSIQNPGAILQASPVYQHLSAKSFAKGPFVLDRDYAMDEMEALLPLIGINFNRGTFDALVAHAMDSIQQPVTSPSITTPIQFLQNWLPGIVEVITAKQAIDEILGRDTVGSWSDAEIVQQVIENAGSPVPYTDYGNVPLSNWNQNFVTRTVVRFELGLRVGPLEQEQASRVRVDSAGQKRKSDAIQLEIQRNALGFYGYNDGNGRTYGLLNDPNLPAFVSAPNGDWATATFLEIQQDLLTLFQLLRTGSQDRIEPNKQALTLVLPTNSVDYLATVSDFGYSVWAWLKEFYPGVRVVSCPQYNDANGGANILSVHADTVLDSGTDDQKTFAQIVPATFQLLGIQKLAKGYEEDYSNASAGVLCKRPYAVVRFTGI